MRAVGELELLFESCSHAELPHDQITPVTVSDFHCTFFPSALAALDRSYRLAGTSRRRPCLRVTSLAPGKHIVRLTVELLGKWAMMTFKVLSLTLLLVLPAA